MAEEDFTGEGLFHLRAAASNLLEDAVYLNNHHILDAGGAVVFAPDDEFDDELLQCFGGREEHRDVRGGPHVRLDHRG